MASGLIGASHVLALEDGQAGLHGRPETRRSGRGRLLRMRPQIVFPAPTLQRELFRLTRGIGSLRLAIADGIERLVALGGVQRLGFPTVEAYARERLGRSGRWVGDARTLSRRLASLPGLKEAFLTGRLSASKVELLARHVSRVGSSAVTPEEIEDLVARAEGMTVRALRAALGGAEDEKRAGVVWPWRAGSRDSQNVGRHRGGCHRVRERDLAREGRLGRDRRPLAGPRHYLDHQDISRSRRPGRAPCAGRGSPTPGASASLARRARGRARARAPGPRDGIR